MEGNRCSCIACLLSFLFSVITTDLKEQTDKDMTNIEYRILTSEVAMRNWAGIRQTIVSYLRYTPIQACIRVER